MGDFKLVRTRPGRKIELYNLAKDIGEQNDVGKENPEILAKMTRMLTTARTESEVFPLPKPKE